MKEKILLVIKEAAKKALVAFVAAVAAGLGLSASVDPSIINSILNLFN